MGTTFDANDNDGYWKKRDATAHRLHALVGQVVEG